MKCILIKSSGAIIRVKDEQAMALVDEGKAKYMPKSAWKEQGRKYNG